MVSKSVQRRVAAQAEAAYEFPLEAAPLKVIVTKIELETTEGGIALPPTASKGTHEGRVVAVGDGPLLDTGIREEVPWKVGDHVLFDEQHGIQPFTFRGVSYLSLNWRAVYARVKKKDRPKDML